MLKKNLPIVIVVLIALVLIAIVIWLFDKRIERIDQHSAEKNRASEQKKIMFSNGSTTWATAPQLLNSQN